MKNKIKTDLKYIWSTKTIFGNYCEEGTLIPVLNTCIHIYIYIYIIYIYIYIYKYVYICIYIYIYI